MAKIYNDFQPANLMSFAKSFARLNGQPLDKSEIWYSLAEAQAYAATEAAYVGQILAVIDTANNKVSFYGISDSQGTLVPIGAAGVEDLAKTVEELEELLTGENGLGNKLESLLNVIGEAKNEETGAEASGLYAEIDAIEEQLSNKVNASDVYSKTETDAAIQSAVSAAGHLTRKVVTAIADIQSDIDNNEPNLLNTIYLVPALEGLSQDVYDEYMVINGAIEKLGSWEVNLDNYVTQDDFTEIAASVVTKTEFSTELAKKVDAVPGKGLSTKDFTSELEQKLNGIEENAQANVIETVSSDFILEEKHLSLNTLSMNKITGLMDELNKKVDAKAGYGLLSEEDQLKLDKLVIGDNNDLSFSGSVNAENVVGLEAWLNKKANSVKGLSENNLTDEMAQKLEELLFINSVEPTQLKVTSGKLEIIEVDSSKINGLEEALNNKVNVAVQGVTNRVVALEEAMNEYVLKSEHDKDIAEIRDILTWKDI